MGRQAMTGHDGHVLLAVFAVHNVEELVTGSRIPLVEETLLRRTGQGRPGACVLAALTGAAAAVPATVLALRAARTVRP